MIIDFQHYADNLKPTLDEAFSRHLIQMLGDDSPFRSWGDSPLLTGGKKIRGSLLCLVATTLGGSLEDALPRAVAVELIQTATLIHDDFVDQHRSRRNMPAIWTIEGSRRAVLLGDVVFASALQMMSELGQTDGLIAARSIAEVSRGAYLEPLDPPALLAKLETGGLDSGLYEKIIYLKTGILFGAACELGALAAGSDYEARQAWRRYGISIGEAYQIADDLQEVELALHRSFITAEEMASLAATLLYFDRLSRPCILETLRKGSLALEGETVQLFRTVAVEMKTAIDSYLQSAVSEITGCYPVNSFGRIIVNTPGELIRMFDATNISKPPASLQL